MTLSLSIARTIRKNDLTLSQIEDVLEKYHLESLYKEIYKHLLREEKEDKKRSIVVIESPFPLAEESIQHIKKKLQAEDKDYVVTIIPDLLAGFRAKYRDVLYDGSAKRIVDIFTNN